MISSTLFGRAYIPGIGGKITAPISASCVNVRKCPRWSGVSRTTSTSVRRSFKQTSAARASRLSASEYAIAAALFIEQGITSIPSVRKEPLEIAAAEILVAMDDVGERFEIRRREVRFQLDRAPRLRAEHEVSLDSAGGPQRAQRGMGVEAAARAGDADDDLSHEALPLALTFGLDAAQAQSSSEVRPGRSAQ